MSYVFLFFFFFFFQAEDGIRDVAVTGVQTCALPISRRARPFGAPDRGGAAEPGVDLDVGELRQPGERLQIITERGDQRFLFALGPDAHRLHKWRRIGIVLLVETLARDAIWEAAGRDRAISQVGEAVRGDLQVVANEIALGVSSLRPEDFFEVGKFDAGRCAIEMPGRRAGLGPGAWGLVGDPRFSVSALRPELAKRAWGFPRFRQFECDVARRLVGS